MGMIDDVRLWTRVLSSSEVQSLFARGATSLCDNIEGFLFSYAQLIGEVKLRLLQVPWSH